MPVSGPPRRPPKWHSAPDPTELTEAHHPRGRNQRHVPGFDPPHRGRRAQSVAGAWTLIRWGWDRPVAGDARPATGRDLHRRATRRRAGQFGSHERNTAHAQCAAGCFGHDQAPRGCMAAQPRRVAAFGCPVGLLLGEGVAVPVVRGHPPPHRRQTHAVTTSARCRPPRERRPARRCRRGVGISSTSAAGPTTTASSSNTSTITGSPWRRAPLGGTLALSPPVKATA